jgi:hypothetical protein
MLTFVVLVETVLTTKLIVATESQPLDPINVTEYEPAAL